MIFRNWVLQNFPFLEDDFDALTDYELFCKIVEYMRESLEHIKSYDSQFVDFNNRLSEMENYFSNLDVQEEINNKLDDMAESGQLTDIIAQYLGLAGMITFDTVSDMKLAENLVNGSKCATLGYSAVNDKGNAFYKIRTITNSDVIDETTIISLHDDSLVAVLINDGINNIKVFNDNLIVAINNSNELYLNNDTYEIEPTATITKNNIKIYGNNSEIDSSSNLTYIFNFNNAYIENISFVESNITDYSKNILFTGKNITFKKCSFESTVGYSGTIENIIFKECIFNNYYREIVHNGESLNNLEVTNCNFIREQNYSSPYAGNSRILVYSYAGGTSAFSETFFTKRGNGINIKNNTFANGNVRQIHIFNCINVNIENNIFNASGLDSSVIGGSDDLVSLDFVKYFKVCNNYFGESGENELDLLSSSNGEVSNNVMEKPYDYFAIDINWSDYVRTYGESLTDKSLLKSKDIMIKNNKILSNTFTFNITPSDSIHIYNNDITNNVSSNIIIFDDFGTLTSETTTGETITNLDVGENNVKTSLGDFGKIYVRDTYNYVITKDSGHLSKDICCYVSQTATANQVTYCTTNFPCKHGEAGKSIALDGSFRSVTPSLVRWRNSQSERRGIDFIGNRYNDIYWNTIFYTGDYLDKYPLAQDEQDNGSYDGTETTGTIIFKSW